MVILVAAADGMLIVIHAGTVNLAFARFHPGKVKLAPPAKVSHAVMLAPCLFIPFRDLRVLHPAIGVFAILCIIIAVLTL